MWSGCNEAIERNVLPHPGPIPTRLRFTPARFLELSRVEAKRRRKERVNHFQHWNRPTIW